jgi:hypothetical protein
MLHRTSILRRSSGGTDLRTTAPDRYSAWLRIVLARMRSICACRSALSCHNMPRSTTPSSRVSAGPASNRSIANVRANAVPALPGLRRATRRFVTWVMRSGVARRLSRIVWRREASRRLATSLLSSQATTSTDSTYECEKWGRASAKVDGVFRQQEMRIKRSPI